MIDVLSLKNLLVLHREKGNGRGAKVLFSSEQLERIRVDQKSSHKIILTRSCLLAVGFEGENQAFKEKTVTSGNKSPSTITF
jgi:hypothetical protein